MTNKIINIREGEGIQPRQDGYVVDCHNETWFVLINNSQDCCELFGYLSSDDRWSDFIGAELKEVVIVDKALNTMTVDVDLERGGIIFVNFITNRGTFQLAVYNSHNGYYGHEVKVIRSVKDIIFEDTI